MRSLVNTQIVSGTTYEPENVEEPPLKMPPIESSDDMPDLYLDDDIRIAEENMPLPQQHLDETPQRATVDIPVNEGVNDMESEGAVVIPCLDGQTRRCRASSLLFLSCGFSLLSY